MSLVKYYVGEGHLFEEDPILGGGDDHVVGGEDDVILQLIRDKLQPEVSPLVLGAPVGDQLEARGPGVQLLPPVVQGGAP